MLCDAKMSPFSYFQTCCLAVCWPHAPPFPSEHLGTVIAHWPAMWCPGSGRHLPFSGPSLWSEEPWCTSVSSTNSCPREWRYWSQRGLVYVLWIWEVATGTVVMLAENQYWAEAYFKLSSNKSWRNEASNDTCLVRCSSGCKMKLSEMLVHPKISTC